MIGEHPELQRQIALRPVVYDVGPMPVWNGGAILPGEVYDDYEESYRVTIEERLPNGEAWAICRSNHLCLNKVTGKWEQERTPSNRSDAFTLNTRFVTAQEAFEFYQKWRREQIVNATSDWRMVDDKMKRVPRGELSE